MAMSDKGYMSIAHIFATESTCPRMGVGAIIVLDKRIISSGYNGAPAGLPHCHHSPTSSLSCTNAVHAEANAIVWAARSGVATMGSTLYTTMLPCLACANLIIQAGIERVCWHFDYTNREGLERLKVAGIEVSRVK